MNELYFTKRITVEQTLFKARSRIYMVMENESRTHVGATETGIESNLL